MLQLSKKITAYLVVLSLCTAGLLGCNNKDAEGEDAATEAMDDAQNAVADALAGDPVNNGNPDVNRDDANPQNPNAENDAPKPIADRSPVEITRIEVDDPVATGAGENIEDTHEHEPAPDLFPVGECQIEVNGLYQVKLAKDLLKEINGRRKDYGIGQLKQNTSLLACADSRCKEQAYFIGHFRPDGSAFNSVAPDYVQGECIAVDYRTVKDIMEAWFSVNKSREQIMNPFYTQCGISIYDINGTYYIAAEFSY